MVAAGSRLLHQAVESWLSIGNTLPQIDEKGETLPVRWLGLDPGGNISVTVVEETGTKTFWPRIRFIGKRRGHLDNFFC
jgi:hypothetical protein